MQLKFQRSQRTGGVVGNKIIFCLDARADYSTTERSNISKYRLGSQIVYQSQATRRHLQNMGRHLDRVDSSRIRDQASGLARGITSLALAKMNLNISIASLGRGHHIECKDLPELLEAEQTLMDACRSLKQYLDAAATFNGSIILVDFDNGERVDVSQGALQLAGLPPPSDDTPENTTYQHSISPSTSNVLEHAQHDISRLLEEHPKALTVASSIPAAILILALFGMHTASLLTAALLVAGCVVWAMRR